VYRYITFRKQGQQEGWIVQWKDQTVGGFHETQHHAAKMLRDAMGLSSVSMLPKLPPASSVRSRAPRISTCKGVYWHKQKGCYTTRDHTLGRFNSAAEAAHATDARRKALKPSVLLHRVRRIRKVFNNGELPADLEDLYSQAEALKAVAREEPALEPIVIQLKYGTWRAEVLNAWRAHRARVQCPASPESSGQQRAHVLLQVLGLAATEVSKQRVLYWSMRAGQGVSRHSGGQVVLWHFGVLIAQPEGSQGISFEGAEAESDEERQTSSVR
jgi:hypothetical protein